MSEQFAGSVTIDNRLWQIYCTIEADSSISFVRMTFGCIERTFIPGQENDVLTRAGMATIVAVLVNDGIDTDDDFELIEEWDRR